jgi:hypothetical protein
MPDESPLPSPRLNRSALERVLARAAELQSVGSEPGEEFTEEQLIELGREVGLSAQNLRQAMAEERTRTSMPADELGFTARLLGPARAHASRTVAGTPSEVLGIVDAWMQREEILQVKRHFADRMIWEPRLGVFGSVRRALNIGGRGYALSRAHEVAATVIPVDERRVLVSLEADLGAHRGRMAGQFAGATVVGASATGVLVMLGVMVAAAAAPVVVLPAAALYGARGMQLRVLSRAQLALEQLLDRLERGEFGRAPNLLGAIAAAAAALPPRRP